MLSQETVALFLHESGGQFDRETATATFELHQLKNFVAAIAGQAILDSDSGHVLKQLHASSKLVVAQRDQLLAALKSAVRLLGNKCTATEIMLARNQAEMAVANCAFPQEVMRRDIEEFSVVWFEQSQKWIVLLPDGTTIDRNFGAIGYATAAVHDLTGRGEAEFECVETGDFYRYVRDDEFWSAEVKS